MKLLTKGQQESYENAKVCYNFQDNFENKYLKDKKYLEVRDDCHYSGEYRGTAHSICNLKYSVPKKTPYGFFLQFIASLVDRFYTLLCTSFYSYSFPIALKFLQI